MDKYEKMFINRTKAAFVTTTIHEMIRFLDQGLDQQAVLRWIMITEIIDEKDIPQFASDPEVATKLKTVLPTVRNQYAVEIDKFKKFVKSEKN